MPNCTNCKQGFEITKEDTKFFRKLDIPIPVDCPDCRYQQRLIFRNERNLYLRECDATGKQIVSIFSPDKKNPPVYAQEYWWTDKWDPKSYGRDFDFNKSFFEQWKELFMSVPQLALNNNNSENSQYTNQCENNKNCYLLVASSFCEGCMHGMWMQNCKDSIDCLYLSKSELCYEVVNGENCYHCMFSRNIENCSDCTYCLNCIGCSNCIGCVNLRNKKYYIFNEPYSKEEYSKKIKELKIDKDSFEKFALKFPQKFYKGSKTENFSGDYLYEVKNAHNCYNCRYGEGIKNCQDAWKARNCQDLTETLQNDFCFSLEGSAYNNNSIFSMKISETSDAAYCSHCYFSSNLFGCVGLRNAKHCILNKEYKKSDYTELQSKIIEHMKRTGEWGKHFPSQLSHFGYNESVANEYFPLTKEEAKNKGYKWSDYEQIQNNSSEKVLKCEVTGKPFILTKKELEFYKKMDLKIPKKHPDQRHKERMATRNPRKLWKRKCDKCGTEMETTFAPDRPEIVYCEKCYLEAVY